ncbi:MAG: zinc transporter ZupT, partial [Phycisphaerae bacterium]|nr:zinc transporter ZupT [Phycisphaerae bacterium]
MEGSVGIALLLTAGAGLATTIGSVIALGVRRPGPRFMGFTLGFSAGVMVLVSFVELLAQSIASVGLLSASIVFVLGMSAILLVDVL